MRHIIHAAERWLACGCLALAGLLPAAAAEPALQAGSRLGFRATVEGEVFEAHFTRFRVVPVLDAQRQPSAFAVEIRLDSVDSGNPERDAEMRAAEWFDADAGPLARYRALSVVPGANGGLVARGELELRGVTQPVDVPFDWSVQTRRLGMRGTVGLDRRKFGVGPDDTGSVAADVTVFFDLAWQAP